MISFKKLGLLSVFCSIPLNAMTPAKQDNSNIVKQSTLVAPIAAAFDHTTQTYTGTHREAVAIAAGGMLYGIFHKLKPRDFRRDMLQGILNDKTDVNKVYEFSHYMDYPVHIACLSDNYEDLLAEFLARGANIEQISHADSATLLHGCANAPRNLHKIITFLGPIKTKQLINRKNSSHLQTPLHCAAVCQNRDTVALLLAHGAEVNATDYENQTPFTLLVGARQGILDKNPKEIFISKIKNCMEELLLHGADGKIGDTKEAYKNSQYKAAVREVFQECGKQDQLAFFEN